jgi:hypothetical protein
MELLDILYVLVGYANLVRFEIIDLLDAGRLVLRP